MTITVPRPNAAPEQATKQTDLPIGVLRAVIIMTEIVGGIAISALTAGAATPIALAALGMGAVVLDTILDVHSTGSVSAISITIGIAGALVPVVATPLASKRLIARVGRNVDPAIVPAMIAKERGSKRGLRNAVAQAVADAFEIEDVNPHSIQELVKFFSNPEKYVYTSLDNIFDAPNQYARGTGTD